MTESPPPGGGSPPSQMSSPSGGLPVTSAWAGGRNSPVKTKVKMRSFDEIIADAASSRNILEIH